MPIYVYQCETCGMTFQKRQSFSEAPLRTCPECDGAVHRVVQPVGVVFKGSGFYVTDNRAKSSTSTSAEKASSTSGKSGGKAGASDNHDTD